MGFSRGARKLEPLLRDLSIHLTKEARYSAVDQDDERVIYYLGGGFWRAKVVNGTDIYLINPSRSWQEIQTIEQAMCLLVDGEIS
jgi:hypothetical protein